MTSSTHAAVPTPLRIGRATLTFIAFPIGGTLAHLLAGPVDAAGPAALGGMIAGAAIGAGQALGSSGRRPVAASALATTTGLGLGLTAGAELVDYSTELADLAVMGAVSGLAVGAAQAAVAGPHGGLLRRAGWAIATAALWATGWAVTTSIGVDVDERWAVFGSTGAIVASLGYGGLLELTSGRGRTASAEVA